VVSNRVRSAVVASVIVIILVVVGVLAFSSLQPSTEAKPNAEGSAPETNGLPNPVQTGGTSSDEATDDPRGPSTTSAGDEDIDTASSLSVVVNKARPLDPNDYAPSDLVEVPVAAVHPPMLRKIASDAIVKLFADFEDETGLKMASQSAYRSYSAQVSTYNGWVASKGQEAADLTSARPGFSEHQTGLTIDISASPAKCSLAACFADTEQGKWLAENAWKYGFILRYPEGQTDVTGYEFEPWHYRYIGIDLAEQYHDSGAKTLEGFFDLPAAPDYIE